MTHILGMDIGGTKMAAAVVDDGGSVILRRELATPAAAGGPAVLAAAGTLATQLLADAAGAGLAVAGLGIGTAGIVDPQRGAVLSATDTLPGWAGTELGGGLQERLGIPVRVINDVHAHALGESWCGAGRGSASLLLVAVGTGVGGSFVLDGSPLTGARHAAGHAGHLASPHAAGLDCSCGAVGHVEAIAAGPAILRSYRRLAAAVPEDSREVREPRNVLDARDVCLLADQGDVHAAEAVRLSAAATGQLVGGLSNMLDPDVVVISGGVSRAGRRWWQAMDDAVRAELLTALAGLPVRAALLGEDAGVIGAARFAWDAHFAPGSKPESNPKSNPGPVPGFAVAGGSRAHS